MNKELLHTITNDAVHLLKQLIAIPSLSREEQMVADHIQDYFQQKNIPVQRSGNNIYASNKYYDAAKPSILLNSHIDTVPPNTGYQNDPFNPIEKDGKLFGLGSTDAGASLVSLASTFIYFYEQQELLYNIIFAATAEEEISGVNGIESLFAIPAFKNYFSHPDSFAIVGEPTQLDLAIAEKGLLVLDCTVTGKAGHAARGEGDNAIYKAMKVIDWFRNYRFEKLSSLLGEIKMTVTAIYTENKIHNVVPATCNFVVDIRVTDVYSHQEILETIQEKVDCDIKPRSMRLRSTAIAADHPVVLAGISLGKKTIGSVTLSDKSLIPFPSLKCGPGNSAQSHTADEFILLNDIENGTGFYISLLEMLTKKKIHK